MLHQLSVVAEPLSAGMRLESRTAQSIAVCETDFSWMQNAKGFSPCSVEATVVAPCFNGDYTVSALPPGMMYDAPNQGNGTANFCTCSWAAYNLLSACTICQGVSQGTPSWSVYSVGCAGLLSDSFFPSNITLSESVAIPAWAETNPTKWDGETFNALQAQQISSQGIPDSMGGLAAQTQHTKTNFKGPIIGGVVGGLVVLVAMLVIAIRIIRGHRTRSAVPSKSFVPGHKSTYSNASNLLQRPEEYEQAVPHPPFIGPNPTLNSSARSLPVLGSMSAAQASSTVSLRTAKVGPSQQATLASISTDPQRVTPFPYIVSQPTAGQQDRTQTHAAQRIFEDPSNPPQMRANSAHQPTPRQRITPPAYTPAARVTASGHPRHNRKQSSTDTQHSLTSSRNGRSTDIYGHSPSASGSGTGNIAGPVERQVTNATAPGPMHGRSLSGNSRDEKRSNTMLEYNGRDLA